MPSHHGMNHVIGPAMPPRRWVYLITILMLVGISSVSAGTVYRCLDMLEVLGPRPGTESSDETSSGAAIPPDRDVPAMPSGSLTSPSSIESLPSEGRVP